MISIFHSNISNIYSTCLILIEAFLFISPLFNNYYILYSLMILLILVFSSYVLLLFLLSLIPSINLCSVAFSSISNNFKCGFYSIIISSLRYRFNYWLILFHFLIFEQELILALLLVYGISTLNSNGIIIILYLISFIDLFIYSLLYLYSYYCYYDYPLYCNHSVIYIYPIVPLYDN